MELTNGCAASAWSTPADREVSSVHEPFLRNCSKKKPPSTRGLYLRTSCLSERVTNGQSCIVGVKITRCGWSHKITLCILVVIPTGLKGHILVHQEIDGSDGCLIDRGQRPEWLQGIELRGGALVVDDAIPHAQCHSVDRRESKSQIRILGVGLIDAVNLFE